MLKLKYCVLPEHSANCSRVTGYIGEVNKNQEWPCLLFYGFMFHVFPVSIFWLRMFYY